MNYDLFTVSWLLVSFIIIYITVADTEVYSIFSSVCETMVWMYSLCLLLFFFIPDSCCWLIFVLFVYTSNLRILHVYLSFNCRRQYFY